ncbi:ABC transporter permease [Capillimicrobium parvum]|uniref:Ribose import permease protein RbsC n=1 Tax=Capillimicrobium parvum TaxID=2884022 RepID=A0A9E6XV82_9ACTN|nr:ABC transporter permease [Capillimicrobium parvum]UGS34386.1 Ribose import permease protein RbsC [Capillimicrobium parvum]
MNVAAEQEAVSSSSGGAERTRSPRPRGSSSRVLGYLEAYAMVGLLVIVVLFFSFYSKTADTFPTAANLQATISNQAVIAVIALAALIPLVCNQWDLSVGAIAGLSSVFVASALSTGTPVWVGILLGLGLGLLVGGFNALIVTRLRVNAVIATLGTATILEGVVNQKTNGLAVVSNLPASITNFGSGNWLGIPRTAYLLAIVALVVYYLLIHTPAGRYLYALGSNPKGARLVGLQTRLLIAGTFIAAGLLSGLAGIMQVARAGGADPNVGAGFTLPALAAAFLSAAAIKPGRYNVGGTLVAIFFLAALNSGLNLAGAAPYVNSYVNGAALIVGIGLAANLGRKRTGESG